MLMSLDVGAEPRGEPRDGIRLHKKIICVGVERRSLTQTARIALRSTWKSRESLLNPGSNQAISQKAVSELHSESASSGLRLHCSDRDRVGKFGRFRERGFLL